jgi:hypothetical protein
MMVPRPAMNAAIIIMLRITPHSKQRVRRYHHVDHQTAMNGGGDGYKLGEKGE